MRQPVRCLGEELLPRPREIFLYRVVEFVKERLDPGVREFDDASGHSFELIRRDERRSLQLCKSPLKILARVLHGGEFLFQLLPGAGLSELEIV